MTSGLSIYTRAGSLENSIGRGPVTISTTQCFS